MEKVKTGTWEPITPEDAQKAWNKLGLGENKEGEK